MNQMISRNPTLKPESDWRADLQRAYRSVGALLEQLGLPAEEFADLADLDFPLRVPRSFVKRMRRGDPFDPLLLQVLPRLVEREGQPESFGPDPLKEWAQRPAPGLIHKYSGRVLLILTEACAVHCRYCFRRHFPYREDRPWSTDWSEALNWIQSHSSVSEVILSGGDPLSLDDSKLRDFVHRLEGIEHLRTLRIHTRQPVVLPSRVTESLVQGLNASRLRTVVVLHVNHPQELEARDVQEGLQRLRSIEGTLLNQSVLLKGINDDAEILRRLSEALFDQGVLPYYLHLLDRVEGAAHFAIPEARALRVFRKLQERLPGYLVPRLVRDNPGLLFKSTL